MGVWYCCVLLTKNILLPPAFLPFNTPPQPGGPSCRACSNRLPHEASSTYVASDDDPVPPTDYRCPPGAPPGALFAVMDPVPCRCVTPDGSCRGEGVVGKRKAGTAAGGGGGEVPQRTREPYDPPVLWPVNGDKFAYRRDRGPVAHGLRLESAYAQQGDAWGTGEPAFSSYHHMFKVNQVSVDTIWYMCTFFGSCSLRPWSPDSVAHAKCRSST